MKFIILILLTLVMSCQSTMKKANVKSCFVVNGENSITLSGNVDFDTVTAALFQFQNIKENPGPKFLILDTDGGSVPQGEFLIQALMDQPNLHIVIKKAYSMGAFIAQSLPGKRFILTDGSMMFHKVRTVLGYPVVTVESLQEALDHLNSLNLKYALRVTARTHLRFDQYMEKVNQDWWLDPQEALDVRAADSIVFTVPSENGTQYCEL